VRTLAPWREALKRTFGAHPNWQSAPLSPGVALAPVQPVVVQFDCHPEQAAFAQRRI